MNVSLYILNTKHTHTLFDLLQSVHHLNIYTHTHTQFEQNCNKIKPSHKEQDGDMWVDKVLNTKNQDHVDDRMLFCLLLRNHSPSLFLLVCAKCSKPFGPGKPTVKALGKAFHKECMVCKDCGISVLTAGVSCRSICRSHN